MADLGTAVHVAALIGHSNLRHFVMGSDSWTRPATPSERAEIGATLAECLEAGALGMSTSFVDQDRHGRPVPSRAADDAEMMALIDVLADAAGGPRLLEFLPFITDINRQLSDIDRVARWCGERGVACTWNQLAANGRDPSRAERLIAQARALHADGCRVYAQVSPRPFDITISFDQSPAFVSLRSWNFLIQQTPAEKCRPSLRWRLAGVGPGRLGPCRRRLHHLPRRAGWTR